jgi:hypothetical protein
MTAKLTKNPASFTAWSIERNKETSLQTSLQSVPTDGNAGSYKQDNVVLETNRESCVMTKQGSGAECKPGGDCNAGSKKSSSTTGCLSNSRRLHCTLRSSSFLSVCFISIRNFTVFNISSFVTIAVTHHLSLSALIQLSTIPMPNYKCVQLK